MDRLIFECPKDFTIASIIASEFGWLEMTSGFGIFWHTPKYCFEKGRSETMALPDTLGLLAEVVIDIEYAHLFHEFLVSAPFWDQLLNQLHLYLEANGHDVGEVRRWVQESFLHEDRLFLKDREWVKRKIEAALSIQTF